MTTLNILLLEDDEAFALTLQKTMHRLGHCLQWLSSSKQLADQLLQPMDFELILMDLNLGEDTSLSSVTAVRKRYPSAKILIVTGYASIATTVDAIKQGADDYLPKPLVIDDILNAYYGNTGSEAAAVKTLSPKRVEWEHIQRILKDNNGNVSRTAQQLGMHRRTLQRKLQKKPSD